MADLLPLLDHLGMRAQDERAFAFHLDESAHVYLHDVGVKVPDGVDLADTSLARELCHAFEEAFRGSIEADGFNRLVLGAALTARQVEIVRAYARYLRQIGFPFSQQYIESTVVRHAAITRTIVELFEHRFDPDRAAEREGPADADAAVRERIAELLDAVPSLDDDRTLRALLMLVDATLRTNVYREGATPGSHRDVMAFKLDPAKVPDLPLPRPMFEIWVCSPRVEGVHLRGGPIARGGLRWSDRREDFRTEVLGLVKAQMVKNAVIVPTGAKGGFVPKRATVVARGVPRRGRRLLPGVRQRPARPHRQHRRRGDRAAAAHRALRRRRSVPRRRRRQGHRDVQRHRQRDLGVVRLLARRRLRERRQRRLRPQGDGHHRPRRVGERAPTRPCDRQERRSRPDHRGGHRRHERRRVRQRAVALAVPEARGRVRPPARVHRPRSRPGRVRTPSAPGCSRCHAAAGTTTTAASSPPVAVCTRAPRSTSTCRPRRSACSAPTAPRSRRSSCCRRS